MDQLLDDINKAVKIANKTLTKKSEAQRSKDEEKKTAVEMRWVDMESLGETSKRRFTWKQRITSPTGLPKRRMGSETLVYLRESAENTKTKNWSDNFGNKNWN